MKTILDPSFRYTPSFATDIGKTFKRIRSEQASARRKVDRGPLVLVSPVKPKDRSTSR